MLDPKILGLLELVVESYIQKGEPIGSKFLNTLNYQGWAPSTLRKYLKVLEEMDYVYQPYHSAGRVPTLKWWERYVQNVLDQVDEAQLEMARWELKELVKALSEQIEGVVVGFVEGDEYHYLGLQNLFDFAGSVEDLEVLRQIVNWLESQKVIDILSKKNIKTGKINYFFVETTGGIVSIFAIRVYLPSGKKGILAVISPVRTNYRDNLRVLKKVLQVYG